MSPAPKDTTPLDSLPVGRLGIIPLKSCDTLGSKVNDYIVKWRKNRDYSQIDNLEFEGYLRDSYLVNAETPRFGSGEAKGLLKESVRGDDIYLMVDVCNYSLTYSLCGHTNHMSPDDHFQDLKRVIAAIAGKARRINVIMPFLYESRQHKRTGRESLDCALALQELVNMGVDNIITFDAHDPRVQNSIPLHGFETVQPAYQFIKGLFKAEPDLEIDSDKLMVISPDAGGTSRAIYLANVLGVDMGMFYKRRDYSTIIDGRNPIVAHEFLGADVKERRIAVGGWKEESDMDLFSFLDNYRQRGISKVICTDISCDGMLQGPALGLYKEMLERDSNLYLIASGGVSCVDDIYRLEENGVPAVIFGKALYEGRITLDDLQSLL